MNSKDTQYVEDMLSHLEADIKDYDSESEVANFYNNKSVFITGATGFLGKVSYFKSTTKNLIFIFNSVN